MQRGGLSRRWVHEHDARSTQQPDAGVDVPRLIERHKASGRRGRSDRAAGRPCAVLSTFRDSVTAATAVLILVLLVIAAASTGVRAAGIVAAVSAGSGSTSS